VFHSVERNRGLARLTPGPSAFHGVEPVRRYPRFARHFNLKSGFAHRFLLQGLDNNLSTPLPMLARIKSNSAQEIVNPSSDLQTKQPKAQKHSLGDGFLSMAASARPARKEDEELTDWFVSAQPVQPARL
jgi:hypothetical protein